MRIIATPYLTEEKIISERIPRRGIWRHVRRIVPDQQHIYMIGQTVLCSPEMEMLIRDEIAKWYSDVERAMFLRGMP